MPNIKRGVCFLKTDDLLIKYLEIVIDTDCSGLICSSRGGVGKTHNTLNFLKNKKTSYKYVNGSVSPLSLYMLLYKNSDSVIVFDDCDGLLNNDKSINILKASTWGFEGKRLVSFQTNSMHMQGYPEEFEFKGKIIILTNNNHSDSISYKALLSRMLSLELQYTHQDVINKSLEIIDTKKEFNSSEKEELKRTVQNIPSSHDFNLRVLNNLILFYKRHPDCYYELYESSLYIDPVIDLISKYRGKIQNNKDLIMQETGCSRATFYRKLKEYKKREGL